MDDTSYRKTFGPGATALWHFDADCSKWPRNDFIGRSEKPLEKDICPECIELEHQKKKS